MEVHTIREESDINHIETTEDIGGMAEKQIGRV